MKIGMEVDTRGLEELLDELGEKAGEAIRPAAQAGAQVLYDAARRRAPVSVKPHFFYGEAAAKAPKGQKHLHRYGPDGKGSSIPFRPGNLRDAIYQVYSTDNSAERLRAQYHVSFNFQKVPYGFMVEYGTSKAKPQSFMRNALDFSDAAQDAMENEVLKRLDEALR